MNRLFSISYSAQEPALPLYLADRYGLNSSKVGLVLLAGVIPTLFCESLTRMAIIRSTKLTSELA